LSFFSFLCLFSGNIIERHQYGSVHCSCILQDGSCDFLYVEALFCLKRQSFILSCILGLGTVNRRDISGSWVMWLIWSLVFNQAWKCHMFCFCNPISKKFQSKLSLPISYELISAQEGVLEMISMFLSNIFDCKIIHHGGNVIGLVLCSHELVG
jgi:hypothetical protein